MSFIPFDLPGFKIIRIYTLEDKFNLTACSIQVLARCPACQTASSSLYSYYQRSPKDLPSSGKLIRLNLTVKRFRCTNPQCAKKVFAERLPQVLAPNAQRTERLNKTLQIFADNFSAESAACVLKKLSMPVSPNTLLRLLKRAATITGSLAKPLRVLVWTISPLDEVVLMARLCSTLKLINRSNCCPIARLLHRVEQ